MGYLIVIVISYLLGCSNMAYYIARAKKVDLRSGGSGNAGASNATILLGWRAGVLVGLHDIGKAYLAVLLAKLLFGNLPAVGPVAGVACVLGHIFPFYMKFQGGKGFASYLGMTLALNWKLALAVMALVVLLTVVTDYLVVGTFATVLTVPIYTGITSKSWLVAVILCIGTAAILWKHRKNIVRICKGTEIGLRSTIQGKHRVKQ